MKKALSFLLSIFIIFSCLIFSVNASNEATLSIGTATGKAGDTVSLDVELSGNPGLIAIFININYDSNKIVLENVNNGTVFNDNNAVFGNNLSMVPYTMYWYDGLTRTNNTNNGVLGTIDFKIPDDAPSGEIEIAVSYVQSSTFDIDFSDVPLTVVPGKVIVESDETPQNTEPTIAVDDICAIPGNEFEVPVYMYNNPGVVALALDFTYDSNVIELIGTDYGDVFSAQDTIFGNDLTINPFRVVIFDALSHSNYYSNGMLCILKFRVKDSATLSETSLNISYDEDNVFDVNFNNIHFDIQNAKIKLSSLRSKGEAVIDYQKGIIYGLDCGLNSLDDYVYSIVSSLEFSHEATINGFGTGARLLLKQEKTVVEEYIILVFGDVDGDGWYDGMDSIIVNCLANGLLSREQVGEATYMAADCNHDGVINQLDVDLLQQAGLLLQNVDQSKSAEELLETSSAYEDYLNLIDQNPTAEESVDEPTADKPVAEIGVFQWFINFIVKIFNYIKLNISIL